MQPEVRSCCRKHDHHNYSQARQRNNTTTEKLRIIVPLVRILTAAFKLEKVTSDQNHTITSQTAQSKDIRHRLHNEKCWLDGLESMEGI